MMLDKGLQHLSHAYLYILKIYEGGYMRMQPRAEVCSNLRDYRVLFVNDRSR